MKRGLILLFIIVLSFSVNAADYYVSPNPTTSWPSCTTPANTCSLTDANDADAGDTIYLRGGTYYERIDPQGSGSKNNYIKYTNYQDEIVKVFGEPQRSGTVSLGEGTDYVIIDGLNLDIANPPEGKSTVAWIRGDNHIIRNCEFTRETRPDYKQAYLDGEKVKAIAISYSNNNTIENNVIKHMTWVGITTEKSYFNIIRDNLITDLWGNCMNIGASNSILQGTVIENNILSNSFVSDGIQFNGDFSLSDEELEVDKSNRGTIMRNNIIFNHGENAIDLKGTSNHVIEGNIIYGSTGDNNGPYDSSTCKATTVDSFNCYDRGAGAGSITRGSGQSSKDVIIRNNVIYDNKNGIRAEDGYKIYNNVILNNNRDYTGTDSDHTVVGKPAFVGINAYGTTQEYIGIKNNIIGYHNVGDISVKLYGDSCDIDYNLYFNTGGEKLINYKGNADWDVLDLDSWQSLLEDNSDWNGNDEHSIDDNPLFVNVPSKPFGSHEKYDFSLRIDSPARNTGGPLTFASSSGSGKVINVDDAGYFFDGYNAVEGDRIRVGGDTVKITGVDYNNNRITVDRTISWADNAHVYFDYIGSAPDIGAYEFNSEHVADSDNDEKISRDELWVFITRWKTIGDVSLSELVEGIKLWRYS